MAGDARAVITDYPTFRKALADARKRRGLSQLAFDDATGLPDGYQGKVESGARSLGPLSLPLVLQALGCVLILAPRDAEDQVEPERNAGAPEVEMKGAKARDLLAGVRRHRKALEWLLGLSEAERHGAAVLASLCGSERGSR